MVITTMSPSVVCYIPFFCFADDLIYYLVESGCHSHVLRMMSEHGQDSSIVYQCCVILGNMVTTGNATPSSLSAC